MPWIEPQRQPTRDKVDNSHNLPAHGHRVQEAAEEAERIPLRPRNRDNQLANNVRTVAHAARAALEELIAEVRAGYEPPATTDLVAEHGKGLPPSAREALREFLDEARPQVSEGEAGRPREAVRRFSWEIAEQLTDHGWRPKREEHEAPAYLAALIPRGPRGG